MSDIATIYAAYAERIDAVLSALEAEGTLPPDVSRDNVSVEPPRDPSHGDLATNAAMVLAKQAKTNPRALAEKIVEHLQREPDIDAAEIAGPGFINLRLSPDDRTACVLPFSFDYGQNQLFSTWYAGGCVYPLDYLTPRDVVKLVDRRDITTLAGVPPLWVQLTELDWPADVAGKLQRLTNSGGALTRPLVARLRALFPQADLYPMYGLTEAFRSTYLDPDLVDEHPTSMGRAIPLAEILVVTDDGQLAEPGEEGELVHCGPLVAQGYWQDAERTAQRFKPAPAMSEYGGTAVWSGDRVTRDEGGLLYFVGRRDAMIKSAGNRISPQELESAALGTGLVAEAVALGVPDERLGHAIHLVVRPAPDAKAPETDLPKALKKELPNFMQPHVIHWRDTLPLNPNGKLDRTAIAVEIGA